MAELILLVLIALSRLLFIRRISLSLISSLPHVCVLRKSMRRHVTNCEQH